MPNINLKSAGVIIVRFENNVPLVLLLKSYNFWDFPKGKIEGEESKITAALREAKEETGISDLSFPWGKTFYETEVFGKQNKIVYYFIAETKESKVILERNPTSGIIEHDDYIWASFEQAKKLTVNRINNVICWAEDRLFNKYNVKIKF